MENNFGEFLKQKRQEKNLTQKDLSKKLFVSESAISKWEKNIAHPDITLLPELSKILDVTEHEIITASTDKQLREEKIQAKKWRVISLTWNLFFYLSYGITLAVCFICNLAINKTLSWFWIVLSALLLAFTFTNLPQIIKTNKLLFLPLSIFFSICLLLGVCCIYTNGNWFWIASLSVLFGAIAIFMPIYISRYKLFNKIKKYNDFISIAIDFATLNILLLVINHFTISNSLVDFNWYFKIAFPITLTVYLFLNILLSVRFLKINKLLKSSIILFFIDAIYLIIPFIKVNNFNIQEEINQINIFKANFYNWKTENLIENNIHCIIFLTIIFLSIILFIFGLNYHLKNKNKT